MQKNIIIKDINTKKYKFEEIINTVYNEVVQGCKALNKFNISLCEENNFDNPYDDADMYKKSHYICQIKRTDYDTGGERRFKQFHEDRMINSHIVYIDKFRLYLLNYYTGIDDEKEKIEINKKIIKYLKKYYELLISDNVLISENTKETLIPHYETQIDKAERYPDNFSIEISYNKN